MTPLRNLLGNVCDLSVMFDAALAALGRQNEASDKARAARRMGLRFTPPAAGTGVAELRAEAARVVASLRRPAARAAPAPKRARTLDGFLVPA